MTQALEQAMAAFEPELPLGVALSGGADSTALLMSCAAKWPGRVIALHVNHGLQSAATAFERHCAALCEQLQVPLRSIAVDARHLSGQSPEDAARIARYKAIDALALMEYAQPAIKSVAIAQHADDQVETLLLALSRGAGLAGLSAMPAYWQRDGIDFYRPLLDVSARDIRRWLSERQAQFVEDPTNSDEKFTRNRIRAQLLPALEKVFPQFRDTFTRSASHAADAQSLLADLADLDLQAVADTAREGLTIKRLQVLSRSRQGNAIRFWLKRTFGVVPSTAQLVELLDQVAACTTRGHRIHIKVGHGFVQRNMTVLNWYNPTVLLTKT
jgi:tRNA(Ile)-lysidine synthase